MARSESKQAPSGPRAKRAKLLDRDVPRVFATLAERAKLRDRDAPRAKLIDRKAPRATLRATPALAGGVA